jgi:hypothetical protein
MDYKPGSGCLKLFGLIILMPSIEFINVEWIYSKNKLKKFRKSYASRNYRNAIFFSHSNCINKHFDVYAFKKED